VCVPAAVYLMAVEGSLLRAGIMVVLGFVLSTLLIGMLKAAVATLRTPERWSPGDGESEPDDAEAEVLAEEELEHAEA
jgi:hypothetical protein